MTGSSSRHAFLLSLAMLAVSLFTLTQGRSGGTKPAVAPMLLALLGGVVLVGGVVWAIHRAERSR